VRKAMKICSIILLFVYAFNGYSNSDLLNSIKRIPGKKINIVWLEDDKFPKYTASIYFEDGAVSDDLSGLTQGVFDQLTSGTKAKSEKEINEILDFFGTSLKGSVTHEYSILTVQGLTKDVEPVANLVCELFNDSAFPDEALRSYIDRSQSRLRNLVTNHAALADRIFRSLSFKDTILDQPVEGTIASLSQLNSEKLRKRLNEMNNSKKTLYISGPKDALQMSKIFEEKCNWKNERRAQAREVQKPSLQSRIYFVPVANANQSQIRIGRYLAAEEVVGKNDYFHFLSGFLGGGFTSKLIQELRVKRGLTYSANSYVSLQKDYGRAGIMTFTKSETTNEVLKIISEIFDQLGDERTVSEQEFKHHQGHEIGGYAFAFEASDALLGQIMLYDHQKRDLKDLVNFPANIAKMRIEDLVRSSAEVFPWERLTILVVGDKKLEKKLSNIRPVRVLKAEDFL